MLHPQTRALIDFMVERQIPPTHTLAPPEARRLYLERRGFTQPETDLATAGQLDIDLRKQLRIKQRAVQHAVAAVDPVARAERIEAMFGTGMFLARNGQRIHHPAHRQMQPPARAQFMVEEGKIEAGIVRDQRTVIQKVEQILHFVFEQRLVCQKRVGQAVYGLRIGIHLAFRIEIAMEGAPGFDAVDEFDAADLYQPVTLCGAETCGLGIKNNLAHRSRIYRPFFADRQATSARTAANVSDLRQPVSITWSARCRLM